MADPPASSSAAPQGGAAVSPPHPPAQRGKNETEVISSKLMEHIQSFMGGGSSSGTADGLKDAIKAKATPFLLDGTMSQLNTLKVDGSGKAKSRGLREGVRMAQAPYAAAAAPVRVSPLRKPQPSDAPAATGEGGEKEAAPPEKDDGMT